MLDDLRGELAGDGQGTVSRTKGDGTPITGADRLVDRRLTAAVRERFPGHAVLSEEQRTDAPRARWCWVLDPVDGTANLAAGIPWWCISVALCRDGEPVLAVVDAPALDRRYRARRNAGARLNGAALRVTDPRDLTAGADRHEPLRVTAGVLRRASREVRLNPRVLGAIALDLCQVAAGGPAAVVSPHPHVWDVAAGGLVVAEAGGAVVDPDGDGLLPLEPGRDYRDRTERIAAGPTADWLRRLVATLDGAPSD